MAAQTVAGAIGIAGALVGGGLAIGAIQAYIFMLLTIIYFGMAMSHEEEHEEHQEVKHDKKQKLKRNAVLETSQ